MYSGARVFDALRAFRVFLCVLPLALAWLLPGCSPSSSGTVHDDPYTLGASGPAYQPDPGRIASTPAGPGGDTPRPSMVTPRSAATPVPRLRSGIGRVVILDPGHGGDDLGAEYSGVPEKGLNFQIAKLVRDELELMGYTVKLTRNSDIFIPLESRTAFARRNHADIFVSIHTNAAHDSVASGIEVFYPEGGSKRSASSRRLGDAIHRRLEPDTVGPGRGVKPASFVVLRTSSCPAVLVEVGFLSHRTSRVLLTTDSYRRDVARAIAEGIDNYFPPPRVSVR